MADFPRARGRGSFFRGRGSRSRSRATVNRQSHAPPAPVTQQPRVESDTQYQTRIAAQPQRTEARSEIAKYEADKSKGVKRDFELGSNFTEWVEEDRKNVLGFLEDNFDEYVVDRYKNALENVEDIMMLSTTKQTNAENGFKVGANVAVSLRLTASASNTQQNADRLFVNYNNNLESIKVPKFMNAVLSNLGKFTDPAFGNFRIVGPILKAKQRVVKSIQLMYAAGIRDISTVSTATAAQIATVCDGTITASTVLFGDRDSFNWLKEEAKLELQRLRKLIIHLPDGQQTTISISPPYIDPDDEDFFIDHTRVVNFLHEMERWTSNTMDTSNTYSMVQIRDRYIASVFILGTGYEFYKNKAMTLQNYDNRYRNAANNDLTMGDIFTYLGLFDGERVFNSTCLNDNQAIAKQFYDDKAVPYLIRHVNMESLVRNEFGSYAQLVERENKGVRHKNVSVKSISKFTDTNSVVFGGVFSFIRELKFKRNVRSLFKTSEQNVVSQYVNNDIKKF